MAARRFPGDSERRSLWRLAIAAAILSAIGCFSHPAASPLMCKLYS